jgi:hypothetical protein
MSFAKRRSVAELSPGAGLEQRGASRERGWARHPCGEPQVEKPAPRAEDSRGHRQGGQNRDQARPSGAKGTKDWSKVSGRVSLTWWPGTESNRRHADFQEGYPSQTKRSQTAPTGVNEALTGLPRDASKRFGAGWSRLVRGKSEASRGSPGPSKKGMASFGSDRELPLKATEAIGEAQLSEACSVSVAEVAQEFG